MSYTCLHCDARVSETELSGGWCEACGKRIPSSAVAAHRVARAEKWTEVAQAAGPAPRPSAAPRITAGGFLLAFVGAPIGMALGALLFPRNGWGPSILGGLGCATGSTLARALRGRDGTAT